MKRKGMLVIVLFAAVVCIASSAGTDGPFTPAKNLPRGALLFAEVSDLPAIISLWEASEFKAKFLESRNYLDLRNRHLGLKLASRWQEFSEAAGFPLDLPMLARIADKRAAVAVYDIGKLEFVFLAPLSQEAFAATRMTQSFANFTEEEDENGVRVFRVRVDADRGRQKQELMFAHHKGNLAVATNEKLLAKTIANLNNASNGDRLSEDTLFRRLSEQTTTGAATVWVNQTALNGDYYFKRYWLPSDVSALKEIRAGIFNIEIEETRLVERRIFMLSDERIESSVSPAQTGELLKHVPENVAFVHLRTADPALVSQSMAAVIFGSSDVGREKPAGRRKPDLTHFRISLDIASARPSSDSFEQSITDDGDEDFPRKPLSQTDLLPVLDSAGPTAVVTLTRPVVLADPSFVEFHRVAIYRLGAPEGFDRARFESAVEKSLSARTLVPSRNNEFKWETDNSCGTPLRTVPLPVVGRKVSYVLIERNLFIANDDKLLCESISATNGPRSGNAGPVSALAIIDIAQTKPGFQHIFQKLASENGTHDLFAGNIGGLINAMADASKVEVKRNYSDVFLYEEIVLHRERTGSNDLIDGLR